MNDIIDDTVLSKNDNSNNDDTETSSSSSITSIRTWYFIPKTRDNDDTVPPTSTTQKYMTNDNQKRCNIDNRTEHVDYEYVDNEKNAVEQYIYDENNGTQQQYANDEQGEGCQQHVDEYYNDVDNRTDDGIDQQQEHFEIEMKQDGGTFVEKRMEFTISPFMINRQSELQKKLNAKFTRISFDVMLIADNNNQPVIANADVQVRNKKKKWKKQSTLNNSDYIQRKEGNHLSESN